MICSIWQVSRVPGTAESVAIDKEGTMALMRLWKREGRQLISTGANSLAFTKGISSAGSTILISRPSGAPYRGPNLRRQNNSMR
jgi:hypothetical protein